MEKAMHKGEDWTGKKVGSYTILGRGPDVKYPSQKHATARWFVKCDCGKEKLIPKSHIAQERVLGCSDCVGRRVFGSLHHRFTEGITAVTGMYYGKIKAAAKKRKIDFNVDRKSLDTLYQEQEGKCVYTGYDLHFGKNGIAPTASLDRIDSEKPYEMGNVQWVHKVVNMLKGRQTHEEFLGLCKLITERHSKEQ